MGLGLVLFVARVEYNNEWISVLFVIMVSTLRMV